MKKGINIDLQQVSAWCKSNIVLVILAVVSISAVVGLPRVAATEKLKVQELLDTRSKVFVTLDNLSNTRVVDPSTGASGKIVVNKQFNHDLEELVDTLEDESRADIQDATQLNQKDYEVLYSSTLFTNPNTSELETLPELFHRDLELKYKALLELANAGSAATSEDLASYLEDARVRFMETNLSTRQDADLTQEQRSNLQKHLAKLRRDKLRTHALGISVYLDESVLNIPEFSLEAIPTPGELFVWQWRYWVVADMIRGIAKINKGQSELTSLVKRVVSIEILGLPVPDVSLSGGGGRNPRGGSTPPRPRPGGGGLNPTGNPRGGSPPRPKPSPIGGNPPSGGSTSGGMAPTHTGRKSGDLYDLLQVRLTVVVDTKRIPQVLNSLATHNFLTVIDLSLRPTDKLVAMGAGFHYGTASVSEMTVVLEAAWLRSWTDDFMPDSVKKALGIKTNG
jgi:hypothetical protein